MINGTKDFHTLLNNKSLKIKYEKEFSSIKEGIEEIYAECGIKKYKILTPFYFKDFSWGSFFKNKKYKDIINFSPNNELLVSMRLNEPYFQGNLYSISQVVSHVSYVGFPEDAKNLNGNFSYEMKKNGKIIEAKIFLEHNLKIKQEFDRCCCPNQYQNKDEFKTRWAKKFIDFYLAMTLLNEENKYTAFVKENLNNTKESAQIFTYLGMYQSCFLNSQAVR